MNEDKKQDFKKSFPNSFIWFLVAAFLFAFMVQNFIDTKFAKVSFSYQLEHLVNLQLIQPEDSHKIALNDNLVTFSGKFRDRLTDEGKSRFKYINLLHSNHELVLEKERLAKELTQSRDKIVSAAEWYLMLNGSPLPKNGYTVIDDLYNTPEKDNSVIIRELPKRQVISLADLKQQFAALSHAMGNAPSESDLQPFGRSLTELVSNLRAPALGIGNEAMKQDLKNIDRDLTAAGQANPPQRQQEYGRILGQLQAIFDNLDQEQDHVRLSQLRSVRNYKDAVEEYGKVSSELDDNQVQLDKARQSVEHVIWFFNNQELSTRALEKQDPEQFNHWFSMPKKSGITSNTNRGGYFKAPDQPLNTVLEKTFKSEEPAPNYVSYLFTILPVLLVMLCPLLHLLAPDEGGGHQCHEFW